MIVVDDVDVRMGEDDWMLSFGGIESIVDEDWGAVQSRRVHYTSGVEVEFGLATSDWATVPLDQGTARVLSGGFRLLHDPVDLLGEAMRAADPPVRL